MKKSLLLIAVIALSLVAKAQQDPQLTHWMFDRLSFNPAAAGIDRMHTVMGIYRTQWINYSGAPKTFLGNYNGYYNLGGQDVGIGLSVFSDKLGQQQFTVARLSGAYLKNVNGSTFSAGLSLGLMQQQLGNEWVCSDPNDPRCANDATVPKNKVSQGSFDLGLGLMYYKQNDYYVGISATHLTGAEMDKLNFKSARHVYVMGGKNFELNTSQPLVLRTNVLIKSDFKKGLAADINANVLWNQMLWGGISYRPGDAVAPMVGFQKMMNKSSKGVSNNSKVMIGVSYDITTSQIRTYSSGSFEIFGSYSWLITREPPKVKYGNPRFL